MTFWDDNFNEVVAPSSIELDLEFGAIIRVRGAGEFEREAVFELQVPVQASSVLLECIDTEQGFEFDGTRTNILFTPTLSLAIQNTVKGSSEGVVVIDSPFGMVGCPRQLLRHRLLVESLNDQGYGVVYSHTTSSDIAIFTNGCVQVPQRDLEFAISELEKADAKRLIYWVGGVPLVRCSMMVNRLQLRDWFIVYESLDAFDLLARRHGLTWYNSAIERKIAQAANSIVLPNDSLNAFYFSFLPGGSRLATLPDPIPESLRAHVGKPINSRSKRARTVGSFLSGPHIDSMSKFMAEVAAEMPDIDFELVAHQRPTIKLPSNIRVFIDDGKNWKTLSEIVSGWALAIAPIAAGALTYSEASSYQILLDRFTVPTVYLSQYSRAETANGRAVQSRDEVRAEIRKAYYHLGSSVRKPSRQSEPRVDLLAALGAETGVKN